SSSPPADGVCSPTSSVPCQSANQERAPPSSPTRRFTALEAPAARVVAPPVKLAHLPPPVTLTPVSEVVPVLVSVTTMVTVVPTATLDPSAGVELLSVSVVAGRKIAPADTSLSPVDGKSVVAGTVRGQSADQAV